jgi:serine/threonine protein kinase
MELVRGRDLKSLFDSGKALHARRDRPLMAELLAALQHAHERGVVHRDIKPGNIILLDDGGVKVADFGIARLDTSELTQLGSVLGTVSHMSPEQLTGEAVDGRSDLYSCGVILYQLLTGARPVQRAAGGADPQGAARDPPPVSQRVPTLRRSLDDVVHTAMAKQPAQRYADARAFAAALRAALDAVPPLDSMPTRRWCRRRCRSGRDARVRRRLRSPTRPWRPGVSRSAPMSSWRQPPRRRRRRRPRRRAPAAMASSPIGRRCQRCRGGASHAAIARGRPSHRRARRPRRGGHRRRRRSRVQDERAALRRRRGHRGAGAGRACACFAASAAAPAALDGARLPARRVPRRPRPR